MDDNNTNQSSLPTSLIPHLYKAPQQPPPQPLPRTRTRQPILYPRLWREGEPGPSSLVQPHTRYQRDPYPTQNDQYYDSYERQQPPSTYSNRSQSDYTHPPQTHSYSQSQPPTLAPPSDSVPHPAAERPRYRERSEPYSPIPYSYENILPPAQQLFDSYERESYDRHDSYSSYPAPQNLSLSASAPSAAQIHSPVYQQIQRRAASLSRSLDTDQDQDQDHDYDRDRDVDSIPSTSNDGKRPRAESLSTDDGARKSRKTAVACNFCRGRKLRCNGAKPSCHNCTVRKFECEYVPVQRRRGPGKKNGSRSKKTQQPSSKNISDRPPSAVPDYELDALAPELRPHMSVMALDNYGFQPPSPTPPESFYLNPPAAQLQLQDTRYTTDYYSPAPESHFRSRERETSSEDRSGAQSLYRNMG